MIECRHQRDRAILESSMRPSPSARRRQRQAAVTQGMPLSSISHDEANSTAAALEMSRRVPRLGVGGTREEGAAVEQAQTRANGGGGGVDRGSGGGVKVERRSGSTAMKQAQYVRVTPAAEVGGGTVTTGAQLNMSLPRALLSSSCPCLVLFLPCGASARSGR